MSPERLQALAAGVFIAAAVLASGAAVSAGDAPAAATERSAVAFEQLAPVLQGPRCMNCHTSTGFPRQGDDRHRHAFNVSRGPADHGAPGLACSTCHIDRNQAASGVPGAPHWGLAPLSMAWEGLTPGQICRAMTDPRRNGHRSTQALVEHMTSDPLVAWAWAPGSDAHGTPRTLPALDKPRFDSLVRLWASTGARCPG